MAAFVRRGRGVVLSFVRSLSLSLSHSLSAVSKKTKRAVNLSSRNKRLRRPHSGSGGGSMEY